MDDNHLIFERTFLYFCCTTSCIAMSCVSFSFLLSANESESCSTSIPQRFWTNSSMIRKTIQVGQGVYALLVDFQKSGMQTFQC